jgi:hypothetical protein
VTSVTRQIVAGYDDTSNGARPPESMLPEWYSNRNSHGGEVLPRRKSFRQAPPLFYFCNADLFLIPVFVED